MLELLLFEFSYPEYLDFNYVSFQIQPWWGIICHISIHYWIVL